MNKLFYFFHVSQTFWCKNAILNLALEAHKLAILQKIDLKYNLRIIITSQ